jgi:hypothetical protein
MTSEDIPTQYTHSIKLEDTAKGIRISVHVYANNRQTALTEALNTYQDMKNLCTDNKRPIAPMEIALK